MIPWQGFGSVAPDIGARAALHSVTQKAGEDIGRVAGRCRGGLLLVPDLGGLALIL